MKYPKNYYMIFDYNNNLLNITTDYYYFRRLYKKYVKQVKFVKPRYIYSIDLMNNSYFLSISR